MSGPIITTHNNEPVDETLVCENCGSYKVQLKQWIWSNGGTYAGDVECDKSDQWCDDCHTHPHIITYKEFKEQQKEEE